MRNCWEAAIDSCVVGRRAGILHGVVAESLLRQHRVGQVEVVGVTSRDGDARLQRGGICRICRAIAQGQQHAFHALDAAPLHLTRGLLLAGRFNGSLICTCLATIASVVDGTRHLHALGIGTSAVLDGAQDAIALAFFAHVTALRRGTTQGVIRLFCSFVLCLPAEPSLIGESEKVLEAEEVRSLLLVCGLAIRPRVGRPVDMLEELLLVVHVGL
mmetsp:Transcript_113374/g.315622  ORF Transcript_113374/g.315622 Transcript_113374/m.315622 type:complete len:215 (+) Transcript_113374:454-1098(+)